MERIRSGDFASKFKQRNMAVIIGEVDKEELLYGATNPPLDLPGLQTQLQNYYRDDQVTKIKSLYDIPKFIDPAQQEDMIKLHAVYGKMVADGQVYVPSRGLVQSLSEQGIGMDKILRYRISWRPDATDFISLFPYVSLLHWLPSYNQLYGLN